MFFINSRDQCLCDVMLFNVGWKDDDDADAVADDDDDDVIIELCQREREYIW